MMPARSVNALVFYTAIGASQAGTRAWTVELPHAELGKLQELGAGEAAAALQAIGRASRGHAAEPGADVHDDIIAPSLSSTRCLLHATLASQAYCSAPSSLEMLAICTIVPQLPRGAPSKTQLHRSRQECPCCVGSQPD